jgi:hypothetical protein
MVSRQAAKKAARRMPVTDVFFHVEGGRNKSKDIEFRRAFSTFFSELRVLGASKNISMHFVPEQGRQQTFDRFSSFFGRNESTIHLLVVDSEGPIAQYGAVWQHLADRPGDGWTPPIGADNRHAHLMAEAMEAWFFADIERVEFYFGSNGFQSSALSSPKNVEDIPKAQHIDALNRAIRNTPKREYDKFRDAPKVLGAVRPEKVRERAPHCDRIFSVVRDLINELDQ